MSRRKFDRYMVAAGAGNHVKFARLTDSERCAHFLGVLSIAAQAPIRGCLLVGDQEADAIEIAHEARVSEKVAASAMDKLKKIGVLERDDELRCWRVHDWDDVNPAPKEDATAAERAKRYRALRKARHATVTPSVTPPSRRDARDGHAPVTGLSREEVEGEGEEQQTALSDASDLDAARARLKTSTEQQVFDAWIEATGRTGATVFSDKRRRLIRNALKLYSTADVLDAVQGWRKSSHHCGENPSGTVYNDLELLLRDAAHIEKFRDLHRNGNGSAPEPRGDGFGERLNAKAIR